MLNFEFPNSIVTCSWDYIPQNGGRSLKDAAEKVFKGHDRFYIAIPANTQLEQMPIPLSAYSIKEQSVAGISYLFSTRSFRGAFKFHIALPMGKNHQSNLHVVKHLDQDRWVSPKKMIRFFRAAPQNPEWQRRLAFYCFRKYGPELPEWTELVNKIVLFLGAYTGEPTQAISVFRALTQPDPLEAFRACNLTDMVEGASIYCYFSLRGNWAHDKEVELDLAAKYKQGYRHPTQIFCLAALNMTQDYSRTRHYLRSYHHHASRHVEIDKVLLPITEQYKTARLCQLTPPSATAIARARSLLYLSQLLTCNNRHQDALRMRQKARELARKYLLENPDDPDALSLTGELLKHSRLSQDQVLSQHYRKRANSIRSANSSPRDILPPEQLSRRTF
jgi:hypothetical protein